jgi:DNA-binding transcriptional ArsR family regulator
VFKALADPTRRALLDRFRERSGQTLGELCEPLEMARQSATRHLGVLEAANLITTVRRDREKMHYLNPVPLRAIHERWIGKFERPRLRALSATSMAQGAPNRRGSPDCPQGRAIRARHFVANDRQSGTGVTHANGAREACKHICPGQPVADLVGGARHCACQSTLQGDRISVA